MARINWIEDADASGNVADAFAAVRAMSPRGTVPHIARTMSVRPDFMLAIMNAAQLHFLEGALSRAQHEMIASYVSALSRCHY